MALFNQSSKLKISAQIAAENDLYLFECFHDDGMLVKLIENRFEIIAGRKGTGKTAIARYLQKKHEDYGIDYATRLTLSDLHGTENDDDVFNATNLVKFLMVRTAQLLSAKKLLNEDGEKFWQDYFVSHGLQDVSNYNDWFAKTKKMVEKKAADIGFPGIAKADLFHSDETSYERQQIYNEATSTLANRLCESVKDDSKVLILVDDLTDHLDHPATSNVREALEQVKHLLHQLNSYNSKFNDEGVDLLFVCTVRDDLWDFIIGSNENKLVHNCLWLEWTEQSFCKLLIKRLPHFAKNMDVALQDPFNSIKQVFPDEIFDEVLKEKNIDKAEIKHYSTNFYSYMQLISFNRPRDFLRLCQAMKGRLSEINPVEAKHIKASEQEYSTYFYNELKDELNIFSKILNIDISDLLNIMAKLSQKSKMPYSEFKSIISGAVKASHNKTYKFINILWSYSLIGLIKDNNFAKFKHNQALSTSYEFPIEDSLKKMSFILHRGIYWKINKNLND
jgi:hypothetical protein